MSHAIPPTRRRAKYRRRMRRILLPAVILVLLYPLGSYLGALTYPGQASFGSRSVDWVRSMGAGWVVDTVENCWYGANTPDQGNPSAGVLPARTGGAPGRGMPAMSRSAGGDSPAPIAPQQRTDLLPGENQWRPQSHTADGRPEVLTSFVRPDRSYASVLAGVAWINQHVTALALIPGTRDPAGFNPHDPSVGHVPARSGQRLLATFNAGYLMKDAHGGWFAQGTLAGSMRAGAASLVIHRDGTATIGQWGRDATMTPDVAAVRQNLDLVVDRGAIVAGLDANPGARWGNHQSQHQYTWRSGIGIDAHGNLLYVAGDQLTLATLAEAPHEAGAVRGMQLDIHPHMVSFNIYHPDQLTTPPMKLLPTIYSPATRYLAADQRDFFMVTTR